MEKLLAEVSMLEALIAKYENIQGFASYSIRKNAKKRLCAIGYQLNQMMKKD